jgi:hypothetical protein
MGAKTDLQKTSSIQISKTREKHFNCKIIFIENRNISPENN